MRPHPTVGDEVALTLDGHDVRLRLDGDPGAPVVLLLQNVVSSSACWDAVVPALAATFRVIRFDIVRYAPDSAAHHGFDIAGQADRAVRILRHLGVRSAAVVGHSSGCAVAAALTEGGQVSVPSLALIDLGPDVAAKVPEPILVRLALSRFPGRILWRLRTDRAIRAGARAGFARPVEVPDEFVASARRAPHAVFATAMRATPAFLRVCPLPDRLRGTGIRLLVLFGADDGRWRSSSASRFAVVPGARIELLAGVGHTPMMEAPDETAALLAEFLSGGPGADPCR